MGGRGRRSPAIDERVGAFFVPVRVDSAAAPADATKKDKDQDLLAPLPFVVAAVGEKQRSLVYLCDAATDADQHAQFERTLFTDDVGVALRFFACARIDVSAATATALRARYGKQVPLFVAFDAAGKAAGELSMAGFKPDAKGLVDLLDKTVGKQNKLTLGAFVKEYKDVVRDLERLAEQERLLDAKDQKIDSGDKQKRAAIEAERRKLEAEQKKVMAAERELLQQVDLPARAEGAERVGRSGRGGGGRGGGGGGGGGGGR